MNPWKLFKFWNVYRAVKRALGDEVMTQKLKSRKLWSMVLAAVLTTLNGQLHLFTDDTLQWLLGLIGGYIVTQGAVDAVEANAKKKQ